MIQKKDEITDLELGAIVRLRLSELMKDCRASKGRSIRFVARKLKVKRKYIKDWEAGRKCPSGPIMIANFKYYGKEALEKFRDLDFDLQMEKYYRRIDPKLKTTRSQV